MQEIWAEHGSTIIMGVVGLAVAGLAYKLLVPKKKVFVEGMTLNVQCKDCDWQGTVTKYNQTCRSCNGTNLGKM